METTIIISVGLFVFFAVLFTEIFIFRKTISKEEISAREKELNKLREATKKSLRFIIRYNAKAEIQKERGVATGFTLVFAGVLLALFLIALIFFDVPSLRVIMTVISGSMILMIYGLFKMASSKQAKLILLAVILSGGIILYLITKIMSWISF